MTERWLGIVVASSKIVIAGAACDAGPSFTIFVDATWPLQNGPRPEAYLVLMNRLVDFVKDSKIDAVAIKASAVGLGGTKAAHLEAAELRGVVQAAAIKGGARVRAVKQATLSKTYGNRKVDEYLKDNDFWKDQPIIGELRSLSRMAMLMIIAEQK